MRCFVILPSECRLHNCSIVLHLSRLSFTTANEGKPWATCFQADSTVEWHPYSCSQICSNCQGRCQRIGNPNGWIIISLWLEHTHSKWATFVVGNKDSHSSVATARSSSPKLWFPHWQFYSKWIYFPQTLGPWSYIHLEHHETPTFAYLVLAYLPFFHEILRFH